MSNTTDKKRYRGPDGQNRIHHRLHDPKQTRFEIDSQIQGQMTRTNYNSGLGNAVISENRTEA